MNHFIWGMNAMACLIAGLFFVRFWRKTHDRLFLIFAIAFWMFALEWLLAAVSRPDEFSPLLYLIRLVAFVLIIVGIVDKNRAKRREPK